MHPLAVEPATLVKLVSLPVESEAGSGSKIAEEDRLRALTVEIEVVVDMKVRCCKFNHRDPKKGWTDLLRH